MAGHSSSTSCQTLDALKILCICTSLSSAQWNAVHLDLVPKQEYSQSDSKTQDRGVRNLATCIDKRRRRRRTRTRTRRRARRLAQRARDDKRRGPYTRHSGRLAWTADRSGLEGACRSRCVHDDGAVGPLRDRSQAHIQHREQRPDSVERSSVTHRSRRLDRHDTAIHEGNRGRHVDPIRCLQNSH